MYNKYKYIIISFFILLLSSTNSYAFFGLFGNQEVLMIQQSTFPMDQSLTNKNALDGNMYHLNPTWESFEDTQGRKIVEFSALLDTSKYEDGLTMDPVNLRSIFGLHKEDIPEMKEKRPHAFNDKYYLHIQFTLSVDETRFEITYIGLYANDIELARGDSIYRMQKLLTAISSNEAVFEAEILNRRINPYYNGK